MEVMQEQHLGLWSMLPEEALGGSRGRPRLSSLKRALVAKCSQPHHLTGWTRARQELCTHLSRWRQEELEDSRQLVGRPEASVPCHLAKTMESSESDEYPTNWQL